MHDNNSNYLQEEGAMQMTDRVYCIALAALLHDIGKPLQRACGSDKSVLNSEAKSMERADLVGYAHSLWTSDFIFRHRTLFEKIDAIRNYGFEKFQNLASKHHKPDGCCIDEQIISAADKASAGSDREGEQSEETDRTTYITRPLDSLFTRVNLDNKRTLSKSYSLGNLHAADLFPAPEIKLSSEKYAQLMQLFESNFVLLAADNQEIFLDALISLISQYFWCVPSSTLEEYADIPLADHLLTTAAIASAMAIGCDEPDSKPRQVNYRLVAGDFSGIQKYIFALTGESNRSVAQLLRGRSFLVNLYTLLSARMLTDASGLPSLNCITIAGGKFLLIIPDTPDCCNALNETKASIEKWTFDTFFGELKIIIDDGVSFEYDDFKIKNFQKVMLRSSESLNRFKLRPFSHLLHTNKSFVDNKRFAIFQEYGNCKLCGHEPGIEKKNDAMLGTNCLDAIATGQKVTQNNFIVIKKDFQKIFGHYSVEYKDKEPEDLSDVLMCYRINLHTDTASNSRWPELHYANYVPIHEADEDYDTDNDNDLHCKTFEDIAKDGEGLDALAVLKADVDNMGQLFAFGFNKNDGTSFASISRIVAMSRMLNWFFAGYLPRFIETNQEQYGNIYTLFAGGDDLCLIGRWDTMVTFAKEIQEEFNKYTGGNEVITISAGLELFKPGFPVVRAIDNVELLLEKSKSTTGKNSITICNYSMKWGNDFNSQLAFADNWLTFINAQHNENRSNHNAMLYRFLDYHNEWETASAKNDVLGVMKHRFRLMYDINRNLKPAKNESDWRLQLPFRELLVTKTPDIDKSTVFRYLPVGITIAVYSKRKLLTQKEAVL
jgi:CRISPR-associated protein Csm1